MTGNEMLSTLGLRLEDPEESSFTSTAKLDALMLLQVHDELIFELPRKELDSIRAVAARLMPSMELSVPLILDEAVGTNLGNLKEIV